MRAFSVPPVAARPYQVNLTQKSGTEERPVYRVFGNQCAQCLSYRLSTDHNSRTLYSFLLSAVEIRSGETTARIRH